jgi:CheY-like chemotaxis protein
MGIWGARVVAVDDDPDTLDLLDVILRGAGAELVPVSAPGAALATVMGIVPDVLFVDIAMPGEDGAHLLRELRRLSPERGGRVPAVTLTACLGTPEQLAEWSAAGFQRHVLKPFRPEDVLSVVAELSGRVVERRHRTLVPGEWPRHVPRERRRERRAGDVPC